MATLLKEIGVGSAYGTWYLRLYEDSISQSIGNNTSTVNLRLTLRCDNSYATISFDNRDAWIGSAHATPAYSHSAGEHNIASTSVTISHVADGTGSYSVGFGISTSYILSGSSSGGRTLPTIPRASSFSISGNTLGSAVTVSISRASSSFTHTVRYSFGSLQRDYTGQASSCSFTPPLSDASQIPNTSSGSGTITVITYNGSTQIGTKSLPITLNLPASAIPSFTALNISRVDNGVPAAWGVYVQSKSKATVTIAGAAGIYGSSIKSYSISGGGYSSASSTLSTGVLTGKGTINFTGTITDSRGRSATKAISITIYENTPPSLTLQAERCNATGVASNTGTYLKVTPVYNCASVNGKNSISSKKFAITGTSYTNTAAASGASFVLGSNDIIVSKSYEVTGVVTDALGQTSETLKTTVSSSAVPFNLRNDGTGAAFGKYAETGNLLDSAWPIKGTIIKAVNRFTVGYDNDNYSISTNSFISNDWIRTNGTTGWYSQTYSGGFHMTDTTWIRAYNNKKLYVSNTEADAINTAGGVSATSLDTRGGSAWIGKQYASGSEWLGFYNEKNGTRKAMIGHNDSGTVLNIKNETGAAIGFCANNYWLYFEPNSTSWSFRMGSDWNGHIDLGKSWARWSIVYAATGTIQTSDRNKKNNILDINDKYKDLFMQLKPKKYKFNDGTSNRFHIGFIAQDVEEALENSKLLPTDFAGFCKDQAVKVKKNTDGTETTSPRFDESGNPNFDYSLRYDEFIALNTHMIQIVYKEIDLLKKQLEDSNKTLVDLKRKIETQNTK